MKAPSVRNARQGPVELDAWVPVEMTARVLRWLSFDKKLEFLTRALLKLLARGLVELDAWAPVELVASVLQRLG